MMRETGEKIKWGGLAEEMKKSGRIAAPMVAVSMFQYLLQVVSIVVVGRLGQLALSSVAIATSLANVTGFSLLSGMVGGLETLCGQAYGAKQYKKLSVYTYSSIITLSLICIPISILWCFMDRFLILIGQDPTMSHQARNYSLYLIPALFGGAILKPITRYLQTQTLTRPLLLSSFGVLCFNAPICWVLVYKIRMGISGAAVALSISTWMNVVVLGGYVMLSSACERTRSGISRDVFEGVGVFFRLAVPSAVMVCLKWWSMELLVLLSGLLPNPKLETSVLSICLTISTLHFTIPYGFGAAASTRISNELGAGNPQAARTAVWATTCLVSMEGILVITILLCLRHVLGLAYTNDTQVVKYISAMVPLISLSLVTDSLQAVFSGISRGCGWQKIGAYINLGSFYLVGVPVGVLLGFRSHLRAKGLWIGIVVGSVLQSALLFLITLFTNWNKQASEAKERVSDHN